MPQAKGFMFPGQQVFSEIFCMPKPRASPAHNNFFKRIKRRKELNWHRPFLQCHSQMCSKPCCVRAVPTPGRRCQEWCEGSNSQTADAWLQLCLPLCALQEEEEELAALTQVALLSSGQSQAWGASSKAILPTMRKSGRGCLVINGVGIAPLHQILTAPVKRR